MMNTFSLSHKTLLVVNRSTSENGRLQEGEPPKRFHKQMTITPFSPTRSERT